MNKKKILVADDSETMRQMVRMTLQNINYEVVIAADGEQAFHLFNKTNDFDLVVTDINMPKMNGFALIKEIRIHNKIIPILVLTTESEECMRKQGAQAGANGWIVKPFKPKQFVDLIHQILA
jgi:two-component system chemotaxis response regulator CheY